MSLIKILDLKPEVENNDLCPYIYFIGMLEDRQPVQYNVNRRSNQIDYFDSRAVYTAGMRGSREYLTL
ncbi:MAG: hypothetical protein ACLFPL_01230 [Candidatus Nanoarchaeia archaeon]